MSKIKKWINSIVIVIIILIILILVSKFLNNNKFVIYEDNPTDGLRFDNFEKKIELVKNRNDFYIVKNILERFYLNYYSLYDEGEFKFESEEDIKANMNYLKKENIKTVHEMLDDEFLNYYNITEDNLINKIKKISKVKVQITDMYFVQNDSNTYAYFVRGKLLDKSEMKAEGFYNIIKVDMLNQTFSILLDDYANEKYKDIKIDEKVDINIPEKIEKNNNNSFKYKNISDEEYIIDLFENFKDNLIYNKEEAFNSLNKEYASKRFENALNFEKFVKVNFKELFVLKVEKYQKNIKKDYKEYVCMDQNNNLYIFNETSPMNCEVFMDEYTVNDIKFTEKYDSSKKEIKVKLNVDKWIKMLNNRDYRNAYKVLNKTFRENKFENEDRFEEVMRKALPLHYKAMYEEFNDENGTYVQKIVLKDIEGKSDKEIKLSIIMELKDNYEFEMSFSVE